MKMKKNLSVYINVCLALVALVVAVIFFYQERNEFLDAVQLMRSGVLFWILLGLCLTVGYIALQGYMYVGSFATFGQQISLFSATKLFLKRNLVSVFLPAGGVSSLFFFSKPLSDKGIPKSVIHKASYIYGLIGIVSLLVLAIPVFVLFGKHETTEYDSLFLLSVCFVLAIIGAATVSLIKRGWIYRILLCRFPKLTNLWNVLGETGYSTKWLVVTFLTSMLIEVVGIIHIYVSMLVLGAEPNILAATVAYAVGTMLYCFSPFLKGLGAVEISMTLLLVSFGYNREQSISITLIYRIFEFWIPFCFGMFSFFISRNSIVLRLLPAIFIFFMGVVNIVSVFTPSIISRLHLLREYFPRSGIDVSNAMILMFGILLILCSAFLVSGSKTSWYLAIVLSVGSLIGNLTKALDYEEAFMFFILTIVLLTTKKHYFIPGGKRVPEKKWKMALWIFGVVLSYGILGFYLLSKVHFGVDFSLWNALRSTLNSFLLLNDNIVEPRTKLAGIFLYSLNFFGICSIGFLIYSFLRPAKQVPESSSSQLDRAKTLLEKYGRSPLDYFKLYVDKELFFSKDGEGFISYRRCMNSAVVLEGPVCDGQEGTILALVTEFEAHCRKVGMRPSYYRVDEKDLEIFERLGKKRMPIGQEAVVDLSTFTLEGKKRKSIRNAVNSIEKKGYVAKVYQAPIPGRIVQQLQQVSDTWLKDTKRKERVFSQGMFDPQEIKAHDIIVLEDQEGEVLAFLNIIPDFTPGEVTYDLIRKKGEAPGGNMDILILKLIDYCRQKGISHLNMGMAPFSGIDKKLKFPLSALHGLYSKHKLFRQYHGLKEFKEKFDPVWHYKFLVYDCDYDLLSIPIVIQKVMKVKSR